MSLPKLERRRRRLHDEGEDVGTETVTVVTRSSECESEDESPAIELSEQGSAVEDSADQEDETEEGSETETEEGSETEEETGSETEGYTDEEGLGEERQSGDGEEQPEKDKPDDDEDKKNPAYVPRKGAFYEHDFRHGGEGPEVEVPEEAKPKKKLWQDEGKWSHDRYIDDMQAPKSRQELIDAYGYDIRSADRPPEAPPRRQQRVKGPSKQHFKDFIPRMAVIDTTDGGQDSVPNLDGDDFIQYQKYSGGNTRRNNDTRRGGRGGSRGNYRGNDIETKNNRNRIGSGRTNQDGHRSGELSPEDVKSVEDFPSLGESAKQGVPKDVQSSWKRGDNSDRMLDDAKSNDDKSQKPYQPESHDINRRDEYRHNNRDKFQQTQDIRRQDDIRGKSRPQQDFKEERREVFNHGSGRDGNFNNQSQGEKWRTSPNEFRDSYNKGTVQNDFKDNYNKGTVQNDFRDSYSKSTVQNDFRDSYNKGALQNDYRDSYNKGTVQNDFRDSYNKGTVQREFRDSYNKGTVQKEFRDSYSKGSAHNEFRDSYNKGDNYSGRVHDYGYNGRKQQVAPGGNRGPRAGNSGDAGGYYNNNNKHGNKGFEQPLHQQQQPEMAEAPTKDAREYMSSSYTYPEAKSKPKNVEPPSAVSIASTSGGDQTAPSNSKSMVISNKENVQTINVTITNTTTEKKSYAKERRAKGLTRPVEGAVMVSSAEPQTTSVAPISSSPYQGLPPAGAHVDMAPAPLAAGTNHYPQHRQQGMFTEPPLVGGAGAKLYNPSLPPPLFYQRDHGGLPSSQHPPHTPALLPPATALPFGLPVSSTGLALAPNTAGIPANPSLFQPPTGPPPPSSIAAPATAMITAPFLPAGMMYGGGPRVPPPGAPTAFPLTIAYTSPPPQGTVAAAVGSQPPAQGTAPAQGVQATSQHKKVYRGDITYYAPELQQPSRTPQKRPKAAIPIIDPQEVPGQKVEKSEQRSTPEKYTASKYVPSNKTGKIFAPPAVIPTTNGSTLVTKTGVIEGLNQNILPDVGRELKAHYSSSVLSQRVSMSTTTPLQTAPMASSSDAKDVVTAQGNCSPFVNHANNVESATTLEVCEPKRMALKTELSPGGPPVSNTTSNTALHNKGTEQSICTAMQNFQLEGSSSKTEVGVSSTGSADLKQDVCEKPLASSSESSVA